jgi:hypothetical protein
MKPILETFNVLHGFCGYLYVLLLIFHKFLEPDMCFTLKMDSSICDSDACDGLIGPA